MHDVRADSLFTELGGARDLACDECSSAIEARASVAIQDCQFRKPISRPGSRYIRAYKGGSVRLENNTFDPATKTFEIEDSGAHLLLQLDASDRQHLGAVN